MKTTLISIVISILAAIGCCAQGNSCEQVYEATDISILDFYRQYSAYTDPGEYAYLYADLPASLPELCKLIKSQFIHPFAELNQYREQIPRERWNEMYSYPSVESILKGLLSYDSSGLTKDRKPEDRLVLGCQQNAIVLVSIMKHRGIPARVRCGHVTYLIPDFHTSHTICEVWNEAEKRWMLVDPSTDRVDFSPEDFDFSYEAWTQLQKGELDPAQYGVPRRYSGFVSIIGKVHIDLASVLGTEYPINRFAPMLAYAFENDNKLKAEHVEILNRTCKLMKSMDGENIEKLQEIYASTPDIQITETFD